MSKTIDEKVVEMRFDNKQFESNVRTSLSTLDKLKQSLKLDGASKGLENVSGAASKINLSSLGNAVQTVSARFSALQVAAVTALANITNSVVNTGKQMLKSLTIAPIGQGFQEYELKMGSIQTIMASTGESLETVNKYLNELNVYADKTIYSFSDMTNNIGKFTNAGVKLDDAVKAIQGISNEAAVSGANANEASRAMYNFAQALSAGYVKLIDWKSIENANMATVEFKNQLIETAVEMGTVVKVGDKYKTTTTDAKGKVSDLFNATYNFNEALSAQWMTTDVLVKTLGEYADETTKIGKKAFAAAQDIKTFTQLMDTLKEAAGSGWATTWEILFGNFDEAKELWTNVSNVVGGFIDAQSDARNSLLQGWKDLGGRKKLIEALKNTFDGLVSVIKPIGKAFREIFPKTTAKQLYSITEAIGNFTSKLKLNKTASSNLKNTFKGLFAVLDIVKQTFSAVVKAVMPLFGIVDNLGGGILEVTAKFGKWLVKIDDSIKKSNVLNKVLKTVVSFIQSVPQKINSAFKSITGSTVSDTFDKIREKASDFLDTIKEIFTNISNIKVDGITSLANNTSNAFKPLIVLFGGIKNVFAKAFEFFQNADFEKIYSLVNSGILAAIGLGIKKFVGSLTDVGKNASGFIGSLKEILDTVRSRFEVMQNNIKANTLLKLAAAIGILAVSLTVLSGVDPYSLGTALTAITMLFIELSTAMKKISSIGKGSMSTPVIMLTMATSILILSVSLKKLSNLDLDEIAKGLTGLTGIAIIMEQTVKALQKASNKFNKSSLKGLMSFAVSIGVLTLSFNKIASMDIDQIGRGLLGLGGLAVIMGVTIVGLQAASNKFNQSSLKGLMSFAASIGVLTLSFNKIASMDINQIGKGLIGLGGLAVIMGVTIVSLQAASNKFNQSSLKGLMSFAASIGVLTLSFNKIASMDINQIGKGLLGLSGLAVIMGTTLSALALIETKINAASFTKVSAALILMASSIMILTPALKILGAMSISSIAKGLASIAAAFTILGAAGLILGPVSGNIAKLAASMALIGVGAAAFGAGCLAITTALSAFAGSAAVLVAAIVTILTGLITAIPDIVTALAKSLKKALPTIIECLVTTCTAALTALNEAVPLAVEVLLNVIDSVLTSLANHIQPIVESLLEIIVGILDGLMAGIPQIISSAVNLFKSILNAIFEAIGGFNVKTILKATAALTALAAMMTLITAIAAEAVIATATLPLIGMNLNRFITNVKPFLDEIQNVDSASLAGAKTLAQTVLVLTAAGVLDALTSWFTGGKSFIKFGQQLAEFAPYLKEYYLAIKDVDGKIIQASANAAKALSEMASNLPSSGGIVEWFTGNNDMTAFGLQLVPFGKAMKQFSNEVDGINVNAITSSATAGSALAQLASTLPNTGGIVEWFTGSNDMTTFGQQLIPFGEAMKSYSDAISGINAQAVTSSATAGAALVELANTIPNTGGVVSWFTGDNDMSIFGSQLVLFGKAFAEYSNYVKDIDPAVVTASASVGQSLVDLAASLPNTGGVVSWFTGDNDIGSFGNSLKTFGKAFASYYSYIQNVNVSILSGVIKQTSALVSLASGMNNLDTSGMSSFGTSLKKLGQGGIDAFISAFDNSKNRIKQAAINMLTTFNGEITAKISTVNTAFTKVTQEALNTLNSKYNDFKSSAQQIVSFFINGVGSKTESVKSAFINNVAQEALNALKTKYSDFTSSAQQIMSDFISGVKSETKNVKTAFESHIDNAVSAIKSYDDDFEAAGTYIIGYFIDGISTKSNKKNVSNAFTSNISSAVDASEKYYTDFKSAGSYLVDGFAAGISSETWWAEAKARAMASAAANAAKKELNEHSPSKVGYKIGDYFGVAFVNAIDDYASKAYSAGSNIAQSAKSGLSNAIFKVADLVNSNIETEPVVHPILDLSDLERGTQKINSMFSRKQALLVNAQMLTMSGAPIQNESPNVNKSTQFNFTQNNYSPKALSRLDIYRQTKNQLAVVKEAIEHI